MAGNPDAHVDRTYNQTVDARRSTKHRKPADAVDGHSGWWETLDLRCLGRPGSAANPLDQDFDYAREFLTIDLDELARDVDRVLTTSQDWWPADFGHYGPLMLRMAWHSAGTYRVGDGRGGASAGMQRFAPLSGWPDNRNLDKARRLLWPVKKKYGTRISWADLMIFAGTKALESMGFTPFGFGGGRLEVWEADETYWGPEDRWFADERHSGVRDLDAPYGASEMGLIYVDPQGPATVPDPVASAREIRQTFARMAMNDEETVALIAGGHTFGKSHGAADPNANLGAEPVGAPLEQQGLGWANTFGTGVGADAITTGLEGIWTPTPITWDNSFLETLFGYEWEVALSPAGLWQWVPANGAGAGTVPDAHDPAKTHVPTMLTTDLALLEDPAYKVIARKFLEQPHLLAEAFARAWFKLTHIDMGPIHRYLGALAPTERLIWQDPLPDIDHNLVTADDVRVLKDMLAGSGLADEQLVRTAWASASTFRISDKRGGANGARISLEPQRSWEANDPDDLDAVLVVLGQIRAQFNEAQRCGTRISLADLIVLGGCAAVENAAARAGYHVEVPLRPGRMDALQEWTDPDRFAVLEPKADAFRSYRSDGELPPSEVLMVERAWQLTLSAPEMTVLLGGLRVLGANRGCSSLGVLTTTPGHLTNDFFANLLDMDIQWVPRSDGSSVETSYEGRHRTTGETRWVAGRADLIFAHHSELRAVAEVYAGEDAGGKFVRDFVSAWDKVMNLDRFEGGQKYASTPGNPAGTANPKV
ncbi:catalase-peroxidase [Arthrobacter sp. cf158]|uniref:catalase/peroxidase HPI n=1 Tax=Arthrobacter sp. cf158 TaxID=1761744 RepID=UPI00089895D3|nr:catalase/peroxidase HPI [Arthrobacter sp. cf158]SDX60768.1 catalase-peroxidase [Arthrobacter sp. cf158]